MATMPHVAHGAHEIRTAQHTISWSKFYHCTVPWYGQGQPWPLHVTPGVQYLLNNHMWWKGKELRLLQLSLGKLSLTQPLKIPAIWEANFSNSFVLNSIIFSSTGVRGSQIQMGIRFAISFAPCSTTDPNSYLDLLCPFLLLFPCCLTRVWISQPGQI